MSPVSAERRVLDHKYRLGKALLQNERALIVAATHIELRVPVIVKVLDAEARDPRFAAKLRREARQSTAIRSDHVVRYLDIGHLVDGRPYVVMEQLVGETLSERLAREGPLPVSVAVDALLQVCEALASAHVRGILHRDVRTSNVFCTQQPDGRVAIKLLNFGTGRAITQEAPEDDQGLTVAALAVDAPDYKAPEQIVSRRDLDGRVDIWAVGVVLYELLTGVTPFHGTTTQEIVRRVLSADVNPDARIPAEIWPILGRCLASRPDGRYANIAEIAEALAPFASPLTVSYPLRIRTILETPPAAAGDVEEEDDAPTMLGDLLALARRPNKPGAAPVEATITAFTPTGAAGPAGRSPRAPFPGAPNGAPSDGRNRMAVFGVLTATLVLAILVLGAIIARFTLDARRETARASATASPPGDVLPRPLPVATATALPTTTMSAAPTAASTASAPTAEPKREIKNARLRPATGTNAGRPQPVAEGSDPWGWER